jgi:hypothetical protein
MLTGVSIFPPGLMYVYISIPCEVNFSDCDWLEMRPYKILTLEHCSPLNRETLRALFYAVFFNKNKII